MNLILNLMFKHRANNNKKKYVKVKDKKVNDTCELLTQFGDKHTYSGATKPGRKSTSIVLILSSQKTPSLQLKT